VNEIPSWLTMVGGGVISAVAAFSVSK
jgi:hypothetical protein